MGSDQGGVSELSYSLSLANASYDWYKRHAIRSRRSYRLLEVFALVIGTAIPTSAVIFHKNVIIPAVLGAIVVVLSGLRAIFHWQDNYIRYSQAREAVEAERRLYKAHAKPYDDIASRDQTLVAAVSRIEQEEMRGWVKIAVERPTS